jgi:Protein of unknown function (DUF1236)
MTHRFLVSVAAVALIAGAGAANAQGGMDREGGSAATRQSMPSGGAAGGATLQKEPSSGLKSGPSEPKKSQGEVRGQGAEMPAVRSKGKSTENEMKGGTRGERAEQPGQRSKTQGMESETKGAKAARDNMKDDMKTEGMKTEGMKTEGREGRDTSATTKTEERSQTTTGQAGASAKISTEQRTKIADVIHRERAEPLGNVDFQITLGARVPRERVHLRALPREVVTIYPAWRGYEYFLVRDQIVVVDPRSGEIVDILPA